MINPVTSCLSQLKRLWFTRRKPLEDFQTFDDASRGDLDSLKLFIMSRGPHLALLGAIITLTAMSIGPFTQQVLSYPSKTRLTSSAFAPQALDFTSIFSPISYTIGNSALLEDGNDKYISAALYSGISITDASFSSVPTTYPTANCTFPIYSSLGICASVVDVSEHLIAVPWNGPCEGQGLPDACFNYIFSSVADYGDIVFRRRLLSRTCASQQLRTRRRKSCASWRHLD